MKRDDFVFCIGYMGGVAIIDKDAKSKYSNFSTSQLLEKGLYRSAFCSAMYDNSQEDEEAVLFTVNKNSKTSFSSIAQLKRLYGVFEVPENLSKIKVL